jgi:proteasome lid subunit RPN8/RPN11
MIDRRLDITPAVDDAIRAHGQETYPHECCGALVGRGDRVDAIVALPNTTEEGPRRRFLVRPSDYREAERRATELGGELLGFYHSHPDHAARPSQYDLDHAWPTFAYIIVAVAGAGEGSPGRSADLSGHSAESATAESTVGGAKAGDMTVWFLKDDRSTFEEGSLHNGKDTDPDPAQTVHR